MQFRVSVVTERLHTLMGWGWGHRVVVESRESDWDRWVEYDASYLFDHPSNAEKERKLLYELYCENPPLSLRGKKDITLEFGPPLDNG